MRKIYDEYFYVPEEGKGVVREKVFFARLMLSVVCMAICMIAMGYNAYAYFTANIESNANVIQASTYSLDVSGDLTNSGQGSFSKETETKHTYKLAAGTYDFVLTKSTDTTAKTGYARVDIFQGESVQQFYTQQIGGVLDAENKEITSRTVRIKVDAETTIQFIECWGTYAGVESNMTTYLRDNEGIQVANSTIAKANTNDMTLAPAKAEPQGGKPEQPALDNGGTSSQENVASSQQSEEVNTDNKEQSGEGEQSPIENPQTQEGLN